MKKSTKIIIISLIAAIVIAAAAIVTVLVIRKSQNTSTDTVDTSIEIADEYGYDNPEDTTFEITSEEVNQKIEPAKQPDTTTKEMTSAAAETEATSTTTSKPTTTTTKPAVATTTTTKPTTSAPTTAKSTTTKFGKGSYTVSLSGDSGVAEVRGAGTYRAGDKVTVSTTLLLGQTFRQWSSSNTSLLPNGTNQTYSFTMPAGNVSLKAITYVKPQVTVHAGAGVASVSGGGSYAIGQSVTVSAVMKQGYEFSGWSSDSSGFGSSQQSYTFTMPEHGVTLTATGTAKTFTVSVKSGTGISGVSGSGQYKVGDKVTINATVQQNYSFSSWSGYSVSNSSSASTTFTMPGKDVTITASAKENPKYTITVARGENGITSVSGGGSFYAGASVTVSCQVATGYVFNGWYSSNTSLLKNSTSQSYSFKMPNGNVTLTAKAANNQFTVTVSKGTGIVSVSGGGKYTVGNTVTVNCQVDSAYKFSGWTSSNTELVKNGTTQSYSFKMPKGNVTLTAKAASNKFTLTVSKGTGISSVTGSGSYVAGSSVTVSCTPSQYYVFSEWTSNNTSKLKGSASQSYTFTMPEANVTLTAKAIKDQYKLTVQKGTGISSVSGGGTYSVGDAVTVGCSPSTGYSFVKWTSNRTSLVPNSTSQSFTFNMPKGDVTLTASAEKTQFTVSISKGTGIRTASGAGTYTAGDTVTVYVDVSSGYVFDRWTSNGSTVSTTETYTFTMPKKNVSLTAKAIQDNGY